MRTHADIMDEPEVQWLYRSFGAFDDMAEASPERTHRWFHLVSDDRLVDLQGRLLIAARLTQNYIRLAENLDAPVLAIHETGAFDAPPPDWREMQLSAAVIQELPQGWAARLREWRGIYLITDTVDGARYVGSAYGADNLLGRWQQHVAGARGVTVGLATRASNGFRFSILERLSPDMEPEEVVRREHTWIRRLDTVAHGLNVSDDLQVDNG